MSHDNRNRKSKFSNAPNTNPPPPTTSQEAFPNYNQPYRPQAPNPQIPVQAQAQMPYYYMNSNFIDPSNLPANNNTVINNNNPPFQAFFPQPQPPIQQVIQNRIQNQIEPQLVSYSGFNNAQLGYGFKQGFQQPILPPEQQNLQAAKFLDGRMIEEKSVGLPVIFERE